VNLAAHARGAALRASRLSLALAQPRGWSALRAGVAPARLLRYREIEAFHGLAFGTVLYVGANRGQDLPLLLNAFPAAHVHCFEPAPSAYGDLTRRWGSEPRISCWQTALGAETGTAVLHLSETHDQANSLRTPDPRMQDVFPEIGVWSDVEVPVVTLDDWAAGVDLPGDVLLKMDVQGAEDLVLAGARQLLRRVTAVVAEVAVTPTYEGAPDATRLVGLLAEHGFAFGGELDAVRSPATLEIVEYDGVFVRRARPR
jgi:FkbM family methyltransferase